MKLRLVLFQVLLLTCNMAFAEVYLTYDKNTKDIIDFAPDKAVVMQDGWERIVLSGDLPDYALAYHCTNYKYQNDRFVVNVKKLSDEALAQEKAERKAKRKKKIEDRMYKDIEQKLIAEGVIGEVE